MLYSCTYMATVVVKGLTGLQVVFGRQEQNALPVLLPLIDVIPEVLLNAVIVHLRQGTTNACTHVTALLLACWYQTILSVANFY